MCTHQFGHELRLEVKGNLVESNVCRTDDDVISQQQRWRRALQLKGWRR
jgi:hypothetical protein